MSQVAVIDCGTNSIRLLIAEISGSTFKEVIRTMEIVRLGQGVDENKAFHPDAINRTLLAVKSFKEIIDRNNVDKIRYMNAPILNNGGWHLSYFGDSKFISNKIKNFSHQEYNSDQYTNEENISMRVNSGKDLFGRSINFQHISIDQNKNLPFNYMFLLDCLKTNA